MAGKLTKEQRMYAREKLHSMQKGKCFYCAEEIIVLHPGVMPSEDWRRATLSKNRSRLVLGCQRCATKAALPPIDHDFNTIDRMIAA